MRDFTDMFYLKDMFGGPLAADHLPVRTAVHPPLGWRSFRLPPILFLRICFWSVFLLLHLFIVLYLYFHVQTFQIWFVGACCSAGSTMPLDSSSTTSLLSNTTINTNTNIVINCIFIIICACLRICIYISVLYLQSAGCQSAPKPHNIE